MCMIYFVRSFDPNLSNVTTFTKSIILVEDGLIYVFKSNIKKCTVVAGFRYLKK